MSNSIIVAGAGSWGTALALLLARNNNTVYLHSHSKLHAAQMATERCNVRFLPDYPFPDNILMEHDLAKLAHLANDWLLVVPSHVFREQLVAIKPHVKPHHRFTWASKGLDPTSNDLLHHTVQEVLGENTKMAAIGGPSFAKEVANQLPTAVLVAANDHTFGEEMAARLRNQHFRVYQSDDLIGVGLGGVLKNIYAIAAGICDGLQLGANARVALITRSIAEMLRCGAALQAKPETLLGLAGVGDLILSCTDNQSRNRRLGMALGQNSSVETALKQIGQVVEGFYNASHVYQLMQKLNIDMPIAAHVHAILNQEINVHQAVKNLLNREPIRNELKLF